MGTKDKKRKVYQQPRQPQQPTGWKEYEDAHLLRDPRTGELLTFLDPCMGTGHMLRKAFDMFFDMYRERFPQLNATEIGYRILKYHLHGIDMDRRAGQIAELNLHLRYQERVKEEQTAMNRPNGFYSVTALMRSCGNDEEREALLEKLVKQGFENPRPTPLDLSSEVRQVVLETMVDWISEVKGE